jgi:membrane-associated phospholipid phosphatase
MLALRVAEWIQLVFVTALALAAWLRPLANARRLRATLLAIIAIAAIFAARFSERWLSPLASSVLRDWLPAALLLVPYWQVGQFFTAPDPQIEARLAAFDRKFFTLFGIVPERINIGPVVALYMQFAYVMVYPLIPLGLVALYALHLRGHVDDYWRVVLPATYLCFGITLLVRALPPRLLPGYAGFRLPATSLGALNREILGRASIQAITFPSGHVASAMAATFVLLRLDLWVGLLFLWIAVSIAAATIVGGYHYAADVLLAIVIAMAVFGVALCI